MMSIFETLLQRCREKKDSLLAIIIANEGSSPQKSGAMMLSGPEGRLTGTIGGGRVEYEAEQESIRLLQKHSSCIKTYALHENAADSIGMVCGGAVTVLFQFLPGNAETEQLVLAILSALSENREELLLFYPSGSLPRLGNIPDKDACFSLPLAAGNEVVLFGGGHVSKALCPLLAGAGFSVTVMDPRPGLANTERFPDADRLITAPYESVSSLFSFTGREYVVILTNGHEYDFLLEEKLLNIPFSYLGVIGSRKKTAAARELLLKKGFSENAVNSIHAPVGLDIGAVTPEEIAISIAAEMILVRSTLRAASGTAPASGCPMHELPA